MRVTLRKHKDKFVRKGYPRVFANLVLRVDGSPKSGDIVEIASADGEVFGRGLYSKESAISVRFLSSNPDEVIDDAFFQKRAVAAVDFRDQILPSVTHRRLIFGESDGLPGTVVDQYNDVLTWSTLSFGMDQRAQPILDALKERLNPTAIIERNDEPLRQKDGLEPKSGVLFGSYSREGTPTELFEDGVQFGANVLEDSNTLFPIDQRFNRLATGRFARGRRVVVPFCGAGDFALHAATNGATSVDLCESSEPLLTRARANAELNEVDNVSFHGQDSMRWLGALVDEKKDCDLVILDPPAFAKTRRQIEEATKAYQRININAFQVLGAGGILATGSRSNAITENDFLKIVSYAARKAGCRLRLLFRGSNAPDHPILSTMPETDYLKFFIFQRLGDESS